MSSILMALAILLFAGADDPIPPEPIFEISVNSSQLKRHMMAFTVSAGEEVTLSYEDSLNWSLAALNLSERNTHFTFEVPQRHGIYSVTASDSTNVQEWLVIVPLDNSQLRTASINSFPIGFYGDGNSRDHLPQRGFIELWPSTFDSRVSTHLSLSDFLGHIDGSWPQYMVLDLALVYKLEMVLEGVSETYTEARDIHCISGFRTPAYNAEIGNETGFSLHLYGSAADFWIEGWPNNELIDDLDRNKRIDVYDAEYIIDVTRALEASGTVSVGGASAYRWISTHGPFVHLDTRGSAAVWSSSRTLVDNPVI